MRSLLFKRPKSLVSLIPVACGDSSLYWSLLVTLQWAEGLEQPQHITDTVYILFKLSDFPNLPSQKATFNIIIIHQRNSYCTYQKYFIQHTK